MSLPQPRPGVLTLKPYIATHGKTTQQRVIKLSANEGALGPSPKAVEAYKAVAADLHRYPEGGSGTLAHAIAKKHGLDEARVICGNGSDELIEVIVKAFAGVGDEVIYTQYGFRMFPITTQSLGATPVMAPEKDFHVDIEAILEKVTERTKIVFLANPNNPTGSYNTVEEVKSLHARLPENVVLVLDAAYAEFVSKNDYSAGIEMVENAQNVIMMRTFSKLYAMAGLRLGWCYGSAYLIDILNRVRGPFNVTAPALAAGLAAVQDQDHVDAARRHNDKWLKRLVPELQNIGITVLPSVCNFLLLRFPEGGGHDSKAADMFLTSRGILARNVDTYHLLDCLRVSIGRDDEMDALLSALKEFMA